MNRLYIKSHDTAQKTMEGLYKDLERRIIASPPGQCPVDLTASFRDFVIRKAAVNVCLAVSDLANCSISSTISLILTMKRKWTS